MLNGELVVSTLREVVKRTDSAGDGRIIKDVVNRALHRMLCGGEFPQQLVLGALLASLRTRKPRLLEGSLGCIQHLFHAQAIHCGKALVGTFVGSGVESPKDPSTTAATSSSSNAASSSSSSQLHPTFFLPKVSGFPKPLTVGSLLVQALVEILSTGSPLYTNDAAVQQKAADLLHLCAQHPLRQIHNNTAVGATMTSGNGAIATTTTSCGSSHPASSRQSFLLAAGGMQCDTLVDEFELVGAVFQQAINVAFDLSLTATSSLVTIASYGLLTTLLRRQVRFLVLEGAAQQQRGGPLPRSHQSYHRTVMPTGAFSSSTILDDYVNDVEPSDTYLAIDITTSTASTIVSHPPTAGGGRVGLADSRRPTLGSGLLPAAGGGSGGASRLFGSAAAAASAQGGGSFGSLLEAATLHLEAVLDDLAHVMRVKSRAASRSLTSVDEQSLETKTRHQALNVLLLILEELPVANCDVEHRSAPWVSALLSFCKYEVLKAVCRNVATVSFFAPAMQLLRFLLAKNHYCYHRELHALLHHFLFPLIQSPFSTASQKLTVVSTLRTLFSSPHLLVAYFINYDCNPSFDRGHQYGGMLESLLDVALELLYVDYRKVDWFSEDQLVQLRCDLLRGFHDFVVSMRRWLYEDPKEYAKKEDDAAISAISRNVGTATRGSTTTGESGGTALGNQRGYHPSSSLPVHSELYLDNWSSSSGDDDEDGPFEEEGGDGDYAPGTATDTATEDDLGSQARPNPWGTSSAAPDESDPRSPTNSDAGLFASSSFAVSPMAHPSSNQPPSKGGLTRSYASFVSGKRRNIQYHWKHVHHLHRNKRILEEAVLRVNKNWRSGRAYLIEQRVIPPLPSPPSSESPAVVAPYRPPKSVEEIAALPPLSLCTKLFAVFLREQPSVDKSILCSIFERVNKDESCVEVLRAYLATFHYGGVPIDVALRDTTCEFMSWDRPQFEAQVWETIQLFFGCEYHQQNVEFYSARSITDGVRAAPDTVSPMMLSSTGVEKGESTGSQFQDEFRNEASLSVGGSDPMPSQQQEANRSAVMSARDADVMAGVLLFLHTSVHNNNVKGSNKMTMPQFVRDGSACMECPLPEAEMQAMYERVSAKRWALDRYNRTPQQQELAERRLHHHHHRSSAGLPASAVRHSSGQPTSAAATGTLGGVTRETSTLFGPQLSTTLDASTWVPSQTSRGSNNNSNAQGVDGFSVMGGGGIAATTSRQVSTLLNASTSTLSINTAASPAAVPLLQGSQFDSYTDDSDKHKPRIQAEQLYVRIAAQYLEKLEAEHRRIVGDDVVPQPYLVPHYAQHIRPMLLTMYGHITAACYFGVREMRQEPILRLVVDTYQTLFDVAAAFCINVSQLQAMTDEMVKRCLRQEDAVYFGSEVRSSVTTYLMNRV